MCLLIYDTYENKKLSKDNEKQTNIFKATNKKIIYKIETDFQLWLVTI